MKKTKLAVIGLIALAIAGCTDTKISGPNNSWTFHNNSLLWTRANVHGSVNTNGVFEFSEDTSTPDQKTILGLASVVAGLVSKAPVP